ncbi:hypothetical protein DFH06DRAFT_550148 [Mycena polygramma]|nr:hypothetical protein DFH06DRAFT_550148 [Mycena polygramma]
MERTTTLTKTSTKSSRSLSTAPILLNLDTDMEHHVDGIPPSPTRPRVVTRALRRKKHLSIYRASCPCSVPSSRGGRRDSTRPTPEIDALSIGYGCSIIPAYEAANAQPLSFTTLPTFASAIPHVLITLLFARICPVLIHRLGKLRWILRDQALGRDLIPRSPLTQKFRLRPLHIPRTPRTPTDDDHTLIAPPPVSRRPSASRFSFGLGGFGSGASPPQSGFSVSGEMEMRMALAALARETRQQDTSFQFQETGKIQNFCRWTGEEVGERIERPCSQETRYHIPSVSAG